VAPHIPLKTATEIANAMLAAGHYAELVDDCASLSIAERVVRKRSAQGPKPRGVLSLPRRTA
jgi:hypothetical protein